LCCKEEKKISARLHLPALKTMHPEEGKHAQLNDINEVGAVG